MLFVLSVHVPAEAESHIGKRASEPASSTAVQMADPVTAQVISMETAEACFTTLTERLHATFSADIAQEKSRVNDALTQVDQSLSQVRADLNATAARIPATTEQPAQRAAMNQVDHRMNDYVVARVQICDGKSTQAVRTWLTDMRSAQGYLSSNREVMTAVLRTTTGPLAKEIDAFLADRQAKGLEQNRLDVPWRLIEQFTRSQFLPANDLLLQQDQLLSMRQAPSDSVSSYSRRFRELAQTAFPHNTRSPDVIDRLIDTYLSGLASQQIMYDVKVAEPGTVEAAISMVEKRNRALECLQRSNIRRGEEPRNVAAVSAPTEVVAPTRPKPQPPQQDTIAKLQHAVTHLTAQVDKLTAAPPRPQMTHRKRHNTYPRTWTAEGRPVCFECGQKNHLARNCMVRLKGNDPPRLRNHRTKVRPYSARQKLPPPSNPPRDPPFKLLGAAASCSPRPEVKLTFNNLPVLALVDTGASGTLLRREIFDRICQSSHRIPTVRPSNVALQSVTGHPLQVLGTTQVMLEGSIPLSVTIVDKLPQEMILGSDELVRGAGRLDLVSGTMLWFDRCWDLHLSPYLPPAQLAHTAPATHPAFNDIVRAFSDIFAEPNGQQGHCSILPLKIQTTGQPVYQRPYRAPLSKRLEISQAVDDMLAAGIISPSSSPWAAPVTLVPKKDGSTRFCVDYRKLNSVTVKDKYPLPLIQDIFDQIGGSTIFSTLDLKSGYHQIPVDPQDRDKTAFTCHRGQFSFNVVPFGLANAPSHFQRVMEIVLKDLLGVCVLIYIDDIVIYSKNMSEHKHHVRQVFERLRAANLKLKPEKCHFAQQEVKLLGFVVNSQGVSPDPDKAVAINKLAAPTSVKQVRSFLGMANYYRQCIPHYAKIAQPLTELTKKNRRFTWGPIQTNAFNKLKDLLTSHPVMSYPRTDLPYRLYTDASDTCVGAILVQLHEDNIERVVQYVSHQLTDTQKRWAVIEKEAFAVVYALTKLRPYLLGADFTIFSDHKPLTSFFSKRIQNSKIQRWAILLEEFSTNIQYCSGRTNERADMLSRLPAPISVIDINQEWIDPTACPDELLFYQLPTAMDGLDMTLLVQSQLEHFPSFFTEAREDSDSPYVIVEGALYSIQRPTPFSACYPRLVLPPPFHKQVVLRAHKEVGHMSLAKTLERVREAYVFPKMRSKVGTIIRSCPICVAHSRSRDKVPMGQMPSPVSPMQMVSLDLIGPLPETESRHRYVLNVLCHCTGWAEAYPLVDKQSETVLAAFASKFIPQHGIPEVVLTDNGTEFTSQRFTSYLQGLKVDHRRTTPTHPQANGKVERFNKTFKDILAKLTNNSINCWDHYVGDALFAYRISTSATTGHSPYYLLYGRQPRAPVSWAVPESATAHPFGSRLYDMAEALKLARAQSREAREDNRRRLAKKANAGKLEVGDSVVILAQEPITFASKWEPQWQITRISGSTCYIRNQVSGATKRLHRDHVKLVDPSITWDVLPPRPKRAQVRRRPVWDDIPGANHRNVDPPAPVTPDDLEPEDNTWPFQDLDPTLLDHQHGDADTPNIAMETQEAPYPMETEVPPEPATNSTDNAQLPQRTYMGRALRRIPRVQYDLLADQVASQPVPPTKRPASRPITPLLGDNVRAKKLPRSNNVASISSIPSLWRPYWCR